MNPFRHNALESLAGAISDELFDESSRNRFASEVIADLSGRITFASHEEQDMRKVKELRSALKAALDSIEQVSAALGGCGQDFAKQAKCKHGEAIDLNHCSITLLAIDSVVAAAPAVGARGKVNEAQKLVALGIARIYLKHVNRLPTAYDGRTSYDRVCSAATDVLRVTGWAERIGSIGEAARRWAVKEIKEVYETDVLPPP